MRASPLAIVVAVLTAGSAVATQPARMAGTVTGEVIAYTVIAGDTWRGLSARFGVDAATIAADNGVNVTARLQAGQVLRVDNRHIMPAAVESGGIFVNVPQRMLFYVSDDVVTAMPVAVGQRGWKTPVEPFTVVTKETDPTWEVPPSIQEEARRSGRHLPPVVPPGPRNPLGRYWIGLSIPSLGVHGTNAPSSVYRASTHGCIRVGPEGIEWLYSRVAVGTPGRIVYEPILLALVAQDVYLEVHNDVYGRLAQPPLQAVRDLALGAGIEDRIDWAIVTEVIAAHHGVARNVARR
jgi:L,D-transpeptidase ErfK/SrfK